jgi:ribosomal protein L11 methyltransferase
MMLQLILKLDLKGKTVLDMGCGTAVLAILAKMKQAATVIAIDNDEWAFQNADENCRHNRVDISVELGDVAILNKRNFDIIFANINRNILLEDIADYSLSLNTGGKLLMSGFYIEDLEKIKNRSSGAGLTYREHIEKNNWVAVTFTKE